MANLLLAVHNKGPLLMMIDDLHATATFNTQRRCVVATDQKNRYTTYRK